MTMGTILNNFRRNLPYGAFFFVIFAVIFGGASWYVEHNIISFYNFGFEWEKRIPFIPAFALIYLSSLLLANSLMFFINSERLIRQAFKALTLQTVVSGICFIMFPAICLYDDRNVAGWASAPFNFADTINLSFNQVPSLHVSLACTSAIFLSIGRSFFIATLLHCWVALVALSTLLIHEHHLIDVIAGYCVAAGSCTFFIHPTLTHQPYPTHSV
jgi:membrane-associated phospholipid phosphatase